LLPDMDGINLLEEVKTQDRYRDLPIVVYTSKDLSMKEEARLKKYAGSVVLKSGLHSADKLLSDTATFLHRVHGTMPIRAQKAVDSLQGETSLAGKKVLVVDDDVRNIFALTSVLETSNMKVIFAENGRDGIQMLDKHPDVDIVLMDVMMPEMDGYETMREIRKNPRHQALPMIAVTAKALKDDREKCIQAGASDYLPKPVDELKLVELLKLWVKN
jgi:CheY-like chemotaxis protein